MRLKEFFSYHHVTGNPQTVLTKQRKSLKEPLKVFTLLSHQDCGLWMPDAGWLAGDACPCHHPLSAPGICHHGLVLTACWPVTPSSPLDINQLSGKTTNR